jgi:hypothetical protein
VRTFVRTVTGAIRRLGGRGAASNAHLEVVRTRRAHDELERQLPRLPDPEPRRAA